MSYSPQVSAYPHTWGVPFWLLTAVEEYSYDIVMEGVLPSQGGFKAKRGGRKEDGKYSIIYAVPFLFRLLLMGLRNTRAILTKPLIFLRYIIYFIGESYFVLTFGLLYFLRLIGRLVIFSPFLLAVIIFESVQLFVYLAVLFISLILFILKSLGELTYAVILLPVNIIRFILKYKLTSIKTAAFLLRQNIKHQQKLIVKHHKRTKDKFSRFFYITKIRLFFSFFGFISYYRRVRRRNFWQLAGISLVMVIASSSFFYFYLSFLQDMPSPFKLKQLNISSSTRIMDRNGLLLYNVYRDENRTLVPLDQLPRFIILATIAIEDTDFPNHHGVSFRGIIRAAKANLWDKQDVRLQGGSTITQQLVKNLYLSSEKTIKRKIKEIILALFMEAYYTKAEILQMYLNEVNYGDVAYGIEEASRYFFGKSAKYLTLAEAALLAGLPEKPAENSPFVDIQSAKFRQHIVLNRMIESGFITQDQAETAKKEKLAFVPPAIHIRASHFTMMIRQALIEKFGKKAVEEGGLQVYTTLDLSVQIMAEQAVRETIAKIKHSHRVGNGAALVMQPQTGEVLALVGSVDYFDPEIKGNVNVVTSLRQPGSAIKPVNYAYAFEHGYHPGNTIDDSAVVYHIPGSKPYAPVNYDGKFKGRMTLRSALAQSTNVVAVKLLNSYGENAPIKMVEQGRKMGITTWNQPERYGLSITLGAAEVTMLDMATVYGTIANLGIHKDPVLIRKVLDAQGKVLVDNTTGINFFAGVVRPAHAGVGESVESFSQKGRRVLSRIASYWLISILSDNKARLPAFGPYAKLEIPGKTVAVKTGTTNDFRDNWTIGFTPDYLVAAWVGNTDNSPMNRNLVSGITGAAPIWNEIMSNLIKDLPDVAWAIPDEMIAVKICATNGLLTCQHCPLTVTEYFAPGTEPKQACNFESPDVCSAKKAQAEAEGKPMEEIKTLLSNCILGTVPE